MKEEQKFNKAEKTVDLKSLITKKESNWEDKLDRSKQGNIMPTYKNHVLFWENHDIFKDKKMKYNDFLRIVEVDGEPMNNVMRAQLRNDLETFAGFRNKQTTDDFVDGYSYKFKYNPVINYLDDVRCKKRDDIKCKDVFLNWFDIEYENDVEKHIIEELSEKWFVSAVKRIYEPGCFTEGMIVLVGKTGIGKSTFVNRLAKGYAVEAAFNIEDEKKSAETLNRCWICNFDEFKSLQNKDPQVVKEYLTKTAETTRLAYRHDAEEYTRHCVFISSTNDMNILKDYTGVEERRFWVMKSKLCDNRKIFNEFTDDVVDAIWADALYIYENNKDYNITRSDFTSNEMSTFIKMQRNFKTFMRDDAMDLIRELLDRKYKLNINGEFSTLEEFKDQINSPRANASDTINRIPISWVNVVMQTLYHTSRKNDKIAAALSDEFEYKKLNCTSGYCMCLVRKGTLGQYNIAFDS